MQMRQLFPAPPPSRFPVEAIEGRFGLRPKIDRDSLNLRAAYMPVAYHADGDDTVTCPRCARGNASDAFFCDQCDNELQPTAAYAASADETVECPICHLQNDTDARYCDQCGTLLAGRNDVITHGVLHQVPGPHIASKQRFADQTSWLRWCASAAGRPPPRGAAATASRPGGRVPLSERKGAGMLEATRTFQYKDEYGMHTVVAGRTFVVPSHLVAQLYPDAFKPSARRCGGVRISTRR